MYYDENKIIKRDKLAEILTMKKKNGNKIILGGGCFDVFHIGILNYLESAKKLGNLLVVAINSDESVKRIRNSPPLFNENQRVHIISSLECIDYVFIFDEDTMEESIRKVMPDIFVKGVDYLRKQIQEVTVATELGIEIKLIGESGNYSVEVLNELNQRYLSSNELMKDNLLD